MVSESTANWTTARLHCKELGGDLATIGDESTMEFIRNNLVYPNFAWIGGQRISDVWSWADGTPWSYENWLHGEPNVETGDVGADLCSAYFWCDYIKSQALYYICQYSPK